MRTGTACGEGKRARGGAEIPYKNPRHTSVLVRGVTLLCTLQTSWRRALPFGRADTAAAAAAAAAAAELAQHG